MVFLAMSWFLSTKIEETKESQVNSHQSLVIGQQSIVGSPQSIGNKQQESHQSAVISRQTIVNRQQKTEYRIQKSGIRKRKPSERLQEIDVKPSLAFGIPVEREKTWQLKERKVALGPQAIVRINIKEEPLPLRGGLGVSAPKEIKKIEVFPPNCLLKKE